MDQINLISAMVSQITASPAFLYVLVFVNMVIFAWETIPQLPSRFIPLVSITLGGVLFPMFISPGTVSPDFPRPMLVLVTNGLLAGLLSFAAHSGVTAFLRAKFGWPAAAAPTPPETKPPEEIKP